MGFEYLLERPDTSVFHLRCFIACFTSAAFHASEIDMTLVICSVLPPSDPSPRPWLPCRRPHPKVAQDKSHTDQTAL